MSLFQFWFDENIEVSGNKKLWLLIEKAKGRQATEGILKKVMQSHYDDLDSIVDEIAELGYQHASDVLKQRLPETKRAKSGDIGEILSAEFAEEKLQYYIPIKKLRYKDGRNLALRGDDFIGFKLDLNKNLFLLKGESKSGKVISQTTITNARIALDRYAGRCTPISLLFIADRLKEIGGAYVEIGKILRKEVGKKELPPDRIEHAFLRLAEN